LKDQRAQKAAFQAEKEEGLLFKQGKKKKDYSTDLKAPENRKAAPDQQERDCGACEKTKADPP
jgi:hypothetical protein